MFDSESDNLPLKRNRLRCISDDVPIIPISGSLSQNESPSPLSRLFVATPNHPADSRRAIYVESDSELDDSDEERLKELDDWLGEADKVKEFIIDQLGGVDSDVASDSNLITENRLKIENAFSAGFFKPFCSYAHIPSTLTSHANWSVLKDYQQAGVWWMCCLLKENHSVILADEMGLGKTAQTCLFLDYMQRLREDSDDEDGDDGEDMDSVDVIEESNINQQKKESTVLNEEDEGEEEEEPCRFYPALILVPRNLMDNWKAELQRWSPQLRVLEVDGDQNARALLLRDVQKGYEDPHVILTTINYARGKESRLKKLKYSIIVIDEAHSMKSANSQQAKGLRSLETVLGRVFLTGTPVQNNARELATLFQNLQTKGTLEDMFRMLEALTTRMMAVVKGDYITRGSKNKKLRAMDFDSSPKKENVQKKHLPSIRTEPEVVIKQEGIFDAQSGLQPAVWALQRLMQPFVLRRLKEDVLSDRLPPKETIVEPLTMTPLQRYLYNHAVAVTVGNNEDIKHYRRLLKINSSKSDFGYSGEQLKKDSSSEIKDDIDSNKENSVDDVNNLMIDNENEADDEDLLKAFSKLPSKKKDVSLDESKIEDIFQKSLQSECTMINNQNGEEEEDEDEDCAKSKPKPKAKAKSRSNTILPTTCTAPNSNASFQTNGGAVDGVSVVSRLLNLLQRITAHPVLVKAGNFTDNQRARVIDVLLRNNPSYKGADREKVTKMVMSMSDYDLHEIYEMHPDKLPDLCLSTESLKQSTKMNRTLELIREAFEAKEKILVFSRFKMVHKVLSLLLSRECSDIPFSELHGDVPPSTRSAIINSFSNDTPWVDPCASINDKDKIYPAPHVLLLTTQVGGQGLNLVASRFCILFDLDWNPQNDRQAEARVHRLGQTRPVVIRKLVCEGTVESKVFEVCSKKLALDSKFGGKAEDVSKEILNALVEAKEAMLEEISRTMTSGAGAEIQNKKKQLRSSSIDNDNNDDDDLIEIL